VAPSARHVTDTEPVVEPVVLTADPAPNLPGGLAVVIPAKDEAARVAATVRAALGMDGVDVVVVVDDGSRDATLRVAADAGAMVVRHPHNRGKAAAMETGAAKVARLDAADALASPRALLFVDADLEASAANTLALAAPVLAGEAEMTIAVLPPQERPGGGRGLVVRLARGGIEKATGWTATQPLSGMRCITRTAFDAARPLAKGWGVETGLTIDVLLAGYRVVEVPCDLHHRVTGTDLAAQVHRARQYRDVGRALAVRWLRRATPLRVLGLLPRG
jgi:glycosyltransferase involved in cell wall biosynthesis